MQMPSPTAGGSAEFIKSWYGDQMPNLFAIHSTETVPNNPNQKQTRSCLLSEVDQLNAAGWNIYFHVNGGDVTGRLKKHQITRLYGLHADYDPPKGMGPSPEFYQWKTEARTKLVALNPTHINDSGRGLQGFWRFVGHYGPDTIETVERMNRQLVAILDGDPAAVDVSRVMKLPGTISYPDEKKAAAGWGPMPATMVSDSGVRLSDGDVGTMVQHLDAVAPVVPPTMPKPIDLPSGPATGYSGPTDDAELVAMMSRDQLRQEAQFFKPCDPDELVNAYWGGDHSAADLAAMNALAFYTGCDVERMVRLFMASALGVREKVRSRPNYVRDTAMKAARDKLAARSYLGAQDQLAALELESLKSRFLENPDDADAVLTDVAKLDHAARVDFVSNVWRGAGQNWTKGELTKKVEALAKDHKKQTVAARGMIPDKNGDVLQCVENVRRTLQTDPMWQGVFRINEFKKTIEITRPFAGYTLPENEQFPYQFTDADIRTVASWINSNGFATVSSAVVWEAIQGVAELNSYHPVHDYLNGLQWDRVHRLHQLWSHYFSCIVDPEIDGHAEYLHHAGQRFAIGAVARVMRPGCKLDTMPVLTGPQGYRKSSGIAAMVGQAWFGDDIPDVTTKDAKEWTAGIWVAEMAEMQAIRGRDANKVKGFMSTRVDRFRASYDKVSKEHKRQTLFVGTGNSDEYIQDTTGGRRYWPLRVGGFVRLDEIERDRDQLWAEAVYLFREGWNWWFNQGECPALEQVQDNAAETTVLDELVARELRISPDGIKFSEIGERVMSASSLIPYNSNLLADAMRNAGWYSRVSQRHGGKRWFRGPKAEPFGGMPRPT